MNRRDALRNSLAGVVAGIGATFLGKSATAETKVGEWSEGIDNMLPCLPAEGKYLGVDFASGDSYSYEWISNTDCECIPDGMDGDGYDFAQDPSYIQIQELQKKLDEAHLLMVRMNGSYIQYVENPSELVQMAAVQKSNQAIKYIKNPSEAVQLVAVNKYGYNIEHIENPSEAVQVAAIKNIAFAIQRIKNPCEEAQLTFVEMHRFAPNDIKGWIKNPTARVQAAIDAKVA